MCACACFCFCFCFFFVLKNLFFLFLLSLLFSPSPQRYVGEGARLVRELFEMARTKKACIIFFDEVDAIGGEWTLRNYFPFNHIFSIGARFDDGAGGDNEVQRTMLELINQLDGFDPRGNIKVLMATNRPDTLDPALLRPGRLDRKIEFGLPDLEVCVSLLSVSVSFGGKPSVLMITLSCRLQVVSSVFLSFFSPFHRIRNYSFFPFPVHLIIFECTVRVYSIIPCSP